MCLGGCMFKVNIVFDDYFNVLCFSDRIEIIMVDLLLVFL